MTLKLSNQKAQIFILDLLLAFFFCLLLLYLEYFIISDHLISKKNAAFVIDQYEQLITSEKLISDPNYLAKKDLITNISYKNQITFDSKNIENIKLSFPSICYLSICEIKKINKNKDITQILKRGVTFENKFCVLEIGFCEK